MNGPSVPAQARTRWLIFAIALLLASVFMIDLLTPLGVAEWVLYQVPMVLALSAASTAVPMSSAAAATVLIAAGFFLSPPGVNPTMALTNRAGGVIAVWAMAIAGRQLIRVRLATRRQDFLQRGHTGLAEALRGDHPVGEVADRALRFLSRYLDAQVGVIYGRVSGTLVRLAGWGQRAQAAPAKLDPGESLTAEVAREGRLLVVEDPGRSDLTIASALSERRPAQLLVAPTSADGHVNGVVELGRINARSGDGAAELLEGVAELLGVALRSAQDRARMQELLIETQRQAEELQTQQEALRVSNEELEEHTRALQKSQALLENQQTELEEINAQLVSQSTRLEAQKQDLQASQRALEENGAELERANQYKSEFLANMSHELRTPLNSALILARMLADNRGGNLTEEQTQYAETIYSAGNDLLALINDILDLSKIEAGKTEIELQDVAISRLLEPLQQTFQPLAAEKALRFELITGPGLPPSIRSDEQRLQQVLRNLLSNAFKFTHQGEVTLTVESAGNGWVAFAVRDTGIGIPPDRQEVIFEAFRQADGTTSRKYGGTGLGLSISRELARLLGGRIEVASTPGQGSTFRLVVPEHGPPPQGEATLPSPAPARHPSLPAPPPAASPAPASAPAAVISDDRARRSRDRLILVIEDDPSFARILQDLSHELDFDCVVASNGLEGLALARDLRPTAVLLDMNLPDGSGLGVLERLKRDPGTRHVPVHVLSVDNYTEPARALGAVGYDLKPVKREEIIDAIKRLEGTVQQKLRRVLVVEDDPKLRDSIARLLRSDAVEIVEVGTAAAARESLRGSRIDCMVLDLKLPDASDFELLEALAAEAPYSFPPVIVYTGRPLSLEEEQRLRRYSRSIIVKGAKSPERLLDEVTLFLHQVESDLPPERQRMLKEARHRDAAFEGRRILVVEDDVRNIFALSSVLEARGAKLEIARNGREALEALSRNGHLDLVLMDIMMPEMDGLTATREIRKRPELEQLPIIALTAKAMRDDQKMCLDAGANDYIAKPIDVEKLLSLCRVWMR